jgi:hypothetical protein
MQTETQQTPAPVPVERTFDEQGNTIAEIVAPAAAPAQAAEAAKFKIGDREFTTAEEAATWAKSEISTLETDRQVADAYRQGMRDAIGQTPGAPQSVTPPPPKPDMAKFYEKPEEYLADYERNITQRVLSQVEQTNGLRAQSDAIWREFTDKHPELADFRGEVEAYVERNTTDVRAIIGTKGRPASYDYIATQLKSDWERKAAVLKPKRQLANTAAGASPNTRAANVTPPEAPKKLETFNEQLNKIRKRGRKA